MNTRVFVATEVDGVATNISARGVGYRLFAIPSLPVPAVAELVHSGAREEKLLRADDMIRMTRSSGNRKLAELLNRNHEKIQFNLNEISQRTARAVSSGLEAILSVAPFEIVFADRVALRANLVERPTGSQASHIAEILKRAVPEAIGSMTPSAQEFIRDTASVRLSWE